MSHKNNECTPKFFIRFYSYYCNDSEIVNEYSFKKNLTKINTADKVEPLTFKHDIFINGRVNYNFKFYHLNKDLISIDKQRFFSIQM